jgi:hypothetical protein
MDTAKHDAARSEKIHIARFHINDDIIMHP